MEHVLVLLAKAVNPSLPKTSVRSNLGQRAVVAAIQTVMEVSRNVGEITAPVGQEDPVCLGEPQLAKPVAAAGLLIVRPRDRNLMTV